MSQATGMNSRNILALCFVIVTAFYRVVLSRSIYVNGSEYEMILQDDVSTTVDAIYI